MRVFLAIFFLIQASVPEALSADSCPYLFGRIGGIKGFAWLNSSSAVDKGKNLAFVNGHQVVVHDLETHTSRAFDIVSPGGTGLTKGVGALSWAGDKLTFISLEEGKAKLGWIDLAGEEVHFSRQQIKDPSTVTEHTRRGIGSPEAGMGSYTLVDEAGENFLMGSSKSVSRIPILGGPVKSAAGPETISYFIRTGAPGKLLGETSNDEFYLFDLDAGRSYKLNSPNRQPARNYNFLGSTKDYAFFNSNGILDRLNLRTRQFTKLQLPSAENRLLKMHEKAISYLDANSHLWVHDIATGRNTKVIGDSPIFNYFATPDLSRIAWSDSAIERGLNWINPDGSRNRLSLGLREQIAHADISPSGTELAALVNDSGTKTQELKIVDMATGLARSVRLPNHTSDLATVNWMNGGKTIVVGGNSTPVVVETASLRAFNARTPATARPNGASLAERASRGEAFIATDFPAMRALLESPEALNQPELAQRYLLSIFGESPVTFEEIANRHPKLLSLMKPDLELDGMPAHKLAGWVDQARSYVEGRMATMENMGRPSSNAAVWENLRPLTPLLRRLEEEEKRDFSNRISAALAEGAREELPGLFNQKIFKFTKQHVRPLFGIEGKNLTEVDKLESPGMVAPVILSTGPINGDPASATRFGIYRKELARKNFTTNQPEGAPLVQQDMSWETHGKKYSAHVDISAGRQASKYLPPGDAPDYAAAWRDGKFSGLVMIGDNMDDEAGLLAEYRDYYSKQGFKFAKKEPVKDVTSWMQKEIEEGRLDYLVKEAHSDGMDRDLFRYYQQGEMEIGMKTLKDGKVETIALFHSDLQNSGKTLLPNTEFGSWIQSRARQENAPPLLYLNTSCSSMQKACNEIASAGSEKLVVLAAESQVDTFQNAQDSAARQLITGLRQQKTFPQIREMMKKDPEYKAGTDNLMLFPDQEEYKTYVAEKSRTPIVLKTEVKDEAGKVIHLDGGD